VYAVDAGLNCRERIAAKADGHVPISVKRDAEALPVEPA
jgi:hypothetical protein